MPTPSPSPSSYCTPPRELSTAGANSPIGNAEGGGGDDRALCAMRVRDNNTIRYVSTGQRVWSG
eukprot:574692-Rhodomonas_salina.3